MNTVCENHVKEYTVLFLLSRIALLLFQRYKSSYEYDYFTFLYFFIQSLNYLFLSAPYWLSEGMAMGTDNTK